MDTNDSVNHGAALNIFPTVFSLVIACCPASEANIFLFEVGLPYIQRFAPKAATLP